MSKMTRDEFGNQTWRNEFNEYHRIDGPAFISKQGTRAWYVGGNLHRVDGPAIIYVNGSASWYIHGERHRDDGPAIVNSDGSYEWYIQNIDITNEVDDWMKQYKINTDYTKWTDKEKVWFKLRF